MIVYKWQPSPLLVISGFWKTRNKLYLLGSTNIINKMLPKRREFAFRMLKYTKSEDKQFARLPENYKKFHRELFECQPKPVHFIPQPGNWERNKTTGIVTPVQNVPLPTMFPKEFHNTLLGGEMVIRGFQKRKPRDRRVPHFWIPHLHRSVVYSEVLNKHISATVTQRLILQIHEYKGFDSYLLENKACDLRTNLALKIKKSILKALLEKDLPYDEVKNQEIYDKYKSFIIPKEDLEWYGLTLGEAIRKQLSIEDAERRNIPPLKNIYRLELLQELKDAGIQEAAGTKDEDAKEGWLSKLKRPFQSSRT